MDINWSDFKTFFGLEMESIYVVPRNKKAEISYYTLPFFLKLV